MGSAKVLTMKARPFKVSHLCFETDGIIGESDIALGGPAPAFDFPAFFAILGAMPTVAGDPSRLFYDFLDIQAATQPFTIAALRAEPRKAMLHKAINARQNAYFSKYGNAASIIAQMNTFFSPS